MSKIEQDISSLLSKLDDLNEKQEADQPIEPPAINNDLMVAVAIEPEKKNLDNILTEEQSKSIIDTEKFIQRYEAVASEILDCCRSDRQEAQEAITLCKSTIDGVLKTTNNPKDVPRIYVEALVKAIEVKANINTNAVKIVDSGARLIASLKSQILNVNNVNTGSLNKELTKILEMPIDSA